MYSNVKRRGFLSRKAKSLGLVLMSPVQYCVSEDIKSAERDAM